MEMAFRFKESARAKLIIANGPVEEIIQFNYLECNASYNCERTSTEEVINFYLCVE